MKEKYNRKLSLRLIAMCILLIGILCSMVTFAGYQMFKKDMTERYTEYAKTILKLSMDSVDKEQLEVSIGQQKENQEYKSIKNKINGLKENAEVQYIYLIYFQDNEESDMRYVMNACTKGQMEEEPDSVNQLGEAVPENDFSDHMKQLLYQAFEGNKEEIGYIVNVTADKELVKTAYCPVVDENGKTVCIFCVDILMTEITDHLTVYVRQVILQVTILAVIFLLLFIFVLEKQIIIPIKKLASSARNFVSKSSQMEQPEDFVFQEVPIHSKDEIQLLGDSLNYMVYQIKEYMTDVSNMTAERERVSAQFQIVLKIKENLFPCHFPAYQERNDFYIYADLNCCKQAGGDFFNFFLLDKFHLCFFVGTASGAGITTTMAATITSIYMENYAKLGYEPNRMLAETNNQISESNSGKIMVDTFAGILDLKSGEFVYAVAGDINPLVKHSGEELKPLEKDSGISIGSLENVIFTQRKIYLSQSDVIFVYTEGFSKSVDSSGNIFTDEYVQECLGRQIQKCFQLKNIINALKKETDEFTNKEEQPRDQTILGVRFMG